MLNVKVVGVKQLFEYRLIKTRGCDREANMGDLNGPFEEQLKPLGRKLSVRGHEGCLVHRDPYDLLDLHHKLALN